MCKRGHVSERTRHGQCKDCMTINREERLSDLDTYAKVLEQNREWKKANMDRIRPGLRARKARLRGAEGTFALQDIELIQKEQGNTCPGCTVKFSKETPYTIDHFVALINGGTNDPSNIQLLCLSCNTSKKDKMWTEWYKLKVAA